MLGFGQYITARLLLLLVVVLLLPRRDDKGRLACALLADLRSLPTAGWAGWRPSLPVRGSAAASDSDQCAVAALRDWVDLVGWWPAGGRLVEWSSGPAAAARSTSSHSPLAAAARDARNHTVITVMRLACGFAGRGFEKGRQNGGSIHNARADHGPAGRGGEGRGGEGSCTASADGKGSKGEGENGFVWPLLWPAL